MEERRAGASPDVKSRPAFQVCEKLRGPLATFAGAAGFRSLLSRALTLARVQAPLLRGIEIQPDGSFQYSAEFHAQLDTPEAAQAAAVLVEQLLGLLDVFIGEALTLRLVQEVWPKAPTKDPRSGGK
jgi:hypothetical protein